MAIETTTYLVKYSPGAATTRCRSLAQAMRLAEPCGNSATIWRETVRYELGQSQPTVTREQWQKGRAE